METWPYLPQIVSIVATASLVGALFILFSREHRAAVWRFLSNWLWIKPRGSDLDPPNHSWGTAEAVSIFTFFAGFIAAQQAWLGIASQGKGKQWRLPLFVLILAIATILGMIRTLRLAEQDAGVPKRAYGYGSIVFGRWVLLVSIGLSFFATLLAMLGQYPGQKPDRVAYTKQLIVTPSAFHDHVPSNQSPGGSLFDRDEKAMTTWYGWVETGAQPTDESRLLWVEQAELFDRKYKTFTAEISVAPGYKILDRHCFLVGTGQGGYWRPVYRQQRFALDPKDRITPTNRFEVFEANPGDQLVVWLRVSGYKVSSHVEDCGVTLKTGNERENKKGKK